MLFFSHKGQEATDGTIDAQGVEIVLQKEAERVWRRLQERILPNEEAKQDGLI